MTMDALNQKLQGMRARDRSQRYDLSIREPSLDLVLCHLAIAHSLINSSQDHLYWELTSFDLL